MLEHLLLLQQKPTCPGRSFASRMFCSTSRGGDANMPSWLRPNLQARRNKQYKQNCRQQRQCWWN
jgi:hypothetical protein